MWLIIRLVLAAIGFAIRQVRRMPLPARDGTFERVDYFKKVDRDKNKVVVAFTIGMQRRSPTWVRMHAESYFDKLCKRLGIANEVQTGDARFDDRVYVTCDHSHVHTILRESQRLRNAVLAAFDAGFHWIRFDGNTVRMRRDATNVPTKRDIALLKAVWAAAGAFEQTPPSRLADPFLWKVLVVEGAIWGLAGYAIGAGMEFVFAIEDHQLWVYLSYGHVVVLGIVVAIIALVVLLAVVALWMRGSSRGHRVIVESAIVLVLGLPVAAIQLVGDSNRMLDNAPSLRVHVPVLRCEVREHRGKRTTAQSYNLLLARTRSVEPRLPAEIQVSRQLCEAAGDSADFEIGPGRWGIPWYRKIRVGDLVVESPMAGAW